jgi:hypothetical protein
MRRIGLLFLMVIAVAGKGQNLLVNGDFELNAPTSFGDNTPFTPTGRSPLATTRMSCRSTAGSTATATMGRSAMRRRRA